ncbi:MAG: carbohydrate ABC transporter permease [Caldilineaceae bacterium]|nr:carbohydrate ABC transporter permease [Caldilineaceae bacterium]
MYKFFRRPSVFRPSRFQALLSYLVLGAWTFVVLFPLYWLLVTSVKLPSQVTQGPVYLPFVDYVPSIHAWQYIFIDVRNDTFRPYTNTVIVGLISSVIALALGAAAAYALVRFPYRPKLGLIGLFLLLIGLSVAAIAFGLPWYLVAPAALALFILAALTIGKRFKRSLGNRDIAFWMISQRILPPVAVIIPVYVLFQQVGNTTGFKLLDTRTGLIIVYVATNLPIVVWLLRDYFQSIPVELEECAQIDGASYLRIFWSIVLPLAVPGLVATFLFILVFAWNEYLFALFLSSSQAQTMPLTVAAQNATRGPQWWYMSVLILIMIAPVILMAIVLERFIARGLLIGAVKG